MSETALPRPEPWERASTPADRELLEFGVGRLLGRTEKDLDSGVQYLPTGWPRLDAALGAGLLVPSLNVIGAGPKSFKSTWAQIVAARNAENGGVSYVLDLENGRLRFLRRVLCRRAELGSREVAAALRDDKAGVFASRQAVERWAEAKGWLHGFGERLFAEFSCPDDFALRVAAARHIARDRPLLVLVDSLQKLPMNFSDRRSSVDQWIRLFETLRGEHEVVFLVVSEIKRDLRGGYSTHSSAFKESGGIEYAADLAMTLEKPDDEAQFATLRVELARESDEDPGGDVATYELRRPHYGLVEVAPVPIRRRSRGPAPAKADAAVDFLGAFLADGARPVSEIVAAGKAEGHSRATLYRARTALGLAGCTVRLENGWKLP